MGRRSRTRARERAASAPAARRAPGGRRRGRLLGWLNPIKPQTRSRAGYGAIGFGLSAALFALLGLVTREPAWFNSAVLLAILALAWGVRAALMRGGDRSS
jgi:hypothetical protein